MITLNLNLCFKSVINLWLIILSLSLEKLLKGEYLRLLSPVQAESNNLFLELKASVEQKIEKHFVLFCYFFVLNLKPQVS